jgi:hypothetical protein
VIIAMILAWFMQVITDKIINVIAMRNSFVPTLWTMTVLCIMTAAFMFRSAGCFVARF